MRTRLVLLASVITVATASTMTLPQVEVDALTAIDTVPTRTQLDTIFGSGSASLTLIAIAQDTGADPGVRLRAILALGKYCPACATSDPLGINDVLLGLIADNRPATTGTDVLILRSAIESVGPLQVPSDLAALTPLLNHGSRDIRAATAHALRDLCNSAAITALHERYQIESIDEVRLAISEALRDLPCP
jgi:hypothetical protein